MTARLPDPPGDDPRPSLVALLYQVRDDAAGFARAEFAWVRAEAGERWSLAMPAMALIAAGVALILGLLIALPIGLMLVLTPLLGPGWAFGAVMLGGALVALLVILWGVRRFKRAVRPLEMP